MTRLFKTLLVATFLLPLAFGAAALAQSSDARLIGSWRGQADEEKLHIVFKADGSAELGDEHGSDKATFTADFAKTPGVLTLKSPEHEDEMKSLIEFVDDNHIRITQPGKELPASVADGSPVVFERDK